MDQEQFDNLTRSVASGLGTRRQALRALGGALLSGPLAGVATRLGLTEGVAAKQKRRADHHYAAPRAEGKPRKKHAKKHDKKRKSNPKGAQDIPLCRLDCEASGGKCCPDGTCVLYGLCCPGERMCVGGGCQPVRQCCDDEWPCPDGSCVLIGDCCPGMKRCGVTSCIPADQCCPGDDSPGCEPCEEEVCVNGEWVCQATDECGPRCGDGYCPDDMSCHHGGTCCRPRTPSEGPGFVCECASGYSAGCNGQCCKSCCYPYCCENL